MYEPSWPDPDEWEPWELVDPRDPFETRKAKGLSLFERRCRHCKTDLRGIPPEECSRVECQAMNVIADYKPTSFKVVNGMWDKEVVWVDYIQDWSDNTSWLEHHIN